jgi:microcystin-dependent protein
MADPFLAEIRIFPFTFAPKNWAFCNGQLLPLSQNTALFSLLGTFYGGDGKSNFALPNLQGSVPMHHGQGPGLSNHVVGESGGSATITLLEGEIPAHTHALQASNQPGEDPAAANHALARSTGASLYQTSPSPSVLLAGQALAPAGGSQPHNNRMPFLTLNFCIALLGVFPPR